MKELWWTRFDAVDSFVRRKLIDKVEFDKLWQRCVNINLDYQRFEFFAVTESFTPSCSTLNRICKTSFILFIS